MLRLVLLIFVLVVVVERQQLEGVVLEVIVGGKGHLRTRGMVVEVEDLSIIIRTFGPTARGTQILVGLFLLLIKWGGGTCMMAL